MWWITQILGVIGIAFMQVFNRWASIKKMSFVLIWMADVLIEVVVAPLFIKSYAIAPTIFQPWFLGTVVIALLGFLASMIFFGEVITITKLIGAVLALAGAVLLIL